MMLSRVFVLSAALSIQALALTVGSPPSVRAVLAAPSIPKVRNGLTLCLRPGIVAATGALKTPAPSDIPRDPVVAAVPLAPGSAVSNTNLPLAPAIPPVALVRPYLKTAVAEYTVSTSATDAVNWYKTSFAKCGYALRWSSTSSNTNGGPSDDSFDFASPTTASLNVRLTFEQSASGDLLLLYCARAISQPPRPAASLVSGAVQRMAVFYVLPGGKKEWKLTLANRANLTAITGAANTLSQDIGVHTCFGSVQSATLRFTASGKPTTYRILPGCYDVYVGNTLRLLDANHATWNALRAAVYDYCLGQRCTKVTV